MDARQIDGQMALPMNDIMSMDDIAETEGVSRSTVRTWRARSQHRFPDPDIVLGPQRLAWRRSTYEAWSRDRGAQRSRRRRRR